MFVMMMVIAASCGSENNPEAIKKEISSNEDKIRDLQTKNESLKQQLAQIDTGSIDSSIFTAVYVQKIKPEPFNHYIEVNGNVQPIEDAFISPDVSGQIKNIVVAEGQYVKRGQLLATLNTEVAQSSIQEIKTNLELAKTQFEKQKELWDQQIGSEMQFLEAKNRMESAQARLKTLNAQLDMARLTAPFDGIVDDILKKEGELAMPGVQIMHLVNINKMKIYANISEAFLNDIHENDKVIVEFPALPDVKITVPIYRIGTVINNQNRTFTMELRIDNQGKKIKPNIISTIKITDFSADSAISIPSIIIKEDRKGKFIFITEKAEEYPVAKKVYIETGLSYKDRTMVIKGLSSGQEVITSGYTLVTDNTPLEIRK